MKCPFCGSADTQVVDSRVSESGDSIRGWLLGLNVPGGMMVGYRGWTRHGVNTDTAMVTISVVSYDPAANPGKAATTGRMSNAVPLVAAPG